MLVRFVREEHPWQRKQLNAAEDAPRLPSVELVASGAGGAVVSRTWKSG